MTEADRQSISSQEFWNGRSVFVTGGSSFLGSWLIPVLLERGARVVGLIRDRSGEEGGVIPPAGVESSGRLATLRGNVTDQDLMRRIIVEHEVDTVFHLAAQTLTSTARQDPAATLEVNVRGTWTVLEAARLTRKCQVLVASSAHVYGNNPDWRNVEDSPLHAKYPYDVSKACSDLICTMYAVTYGLPTGILRYANLFGGGDASFSRSVPGMILATMRGEQFVIRSDGRSIRDYLYVEDAAEATLRLAERLAADKNLSGEAFNLSLEVRMTIVDVADAILRIMKRPDLRPIILSTTTAEVPEQCLNSEKARRTLQWTPRYGMEEGLRKTVNWYRDYMDQHMQHLSPAEAL